MDMKVFRWFSCLAVAVIVVVPLGSTTARAGSLIQPLSQAEAWKRLPAATRGSGQRLPSWALVTVNNLPRTTGAMLELDWLHRTQNEVGPVLRAKMRWVAADANRCEYARATAEADLRRAGADDASVAKLKGGPDRWDPADRDALAFAHQMTVDASAVTDHDVIDLRKAYGDSKVVAMVLLLAAANFQDRLLLSLDIPLEAGGPLAPVDVAFSKDPKQTPPEVPARARPETLQGPPVPTHVDDPEWDDLNFDVLQKNLSKQRANDGRIPVPKFEDVLKRLSPDAPRPKAPVRIKWSLVCMGYQPRLASAWSACTRTFGEEAKQDRVFEESLFWVVTRTIQCFY
jgi:alkylhydroperoxidase family enzyme